MVSVNTVAEGYISVFVTASDKDEALGIADAFSEAFIVWTREIRVGEISDSIDRFEEQIAAATISIEADAQSETERLVAIQALAQATDRLSQLRTALAVERGAAYIIDSAVIEAEDSNVVPYTILGIAVGLIFGIAVAFALDNLDETVRSRRTVRNATGSEPIAVVASSAGPAARLITPKATGVAVRDYRMLAASLSAKASAQKRRVVLVVSATDDEGASTVGLNLAAALAETGRSTTFLEADMRSGNRGSEPGLADLLQHSDRIEGIDWSGTGDESGLVMIDAGTPQEPVERLLGSERFGKLLGLISEHSDWVVIHTSAVLSSADAMWIAPLVDTVLLVVAFWWSQGRRDSRGQDCA